MSSGSLRRKCSLGVSSEAVRPERDEDDKADHLEYTMLKKKKRYGPKQFNTNTKSIIINIIIMSCHRYGYPWTFLATSPYRS